MIEKKNKKGVGGIIIFFVILFSILVVGMIVALLVAVTGIVGDELQPVFQDLGTVDGTNISQIASYTTTYANDVVQQLPWIMGFGYVCMLIFSIAFAVSFTYNPNPVFIGFYVIVVIFIILGAIIASNAYEQMYERNDDIATRLHQQPILSYMILYSPTIMALIAFITGIYIFAGRKEDFASGGGGFV